MSVNKNSIYCEPLVHYSHILWQIIDPILVTFWAKCNFGDPIASQLLNIKTTALNTVTTFYCKAPPLCNPIQATLFKIIENTTPL